MVVKKRNKAFIIVAAIFTCLLSGFLITLFAKENEIQKTEEQNTVLTMKQAWEIADLAAKEWSDDATVVKIISTDYGDDKDSQNGENGLRNCWTFVFHSETKGKQYGMYVRNGVVWMPEETITGIYDVIDMETLKIDSDDAFLTAKSRGLTGGTDWAFGYHYVLQYYVSENDAPQLLLAVRGVNENGNEELIFLSPNTGELISVSEKTGYDDNGNSVWNTKGEVSEKAEEYNQYTDMSRQEIQEEFEVYQKARQYYMDPEELTDAIIQGLKGDKFSPYSNTPTYGKEEWEAMMTERYGEKWKEW